MTDTLTVWWGHDIVGALAINKQGDTSFSYAETWLAKPAARAISLSLPLRAEPFSRRESCRLSSTRGKSHCRRRGKPAHTF